MARVLAAFANFTVQFVCTFREVGIVRAFSSWFVQLFFFRVLLRADSLMGSVVACAVLEVQIWDLIYPSCLQPSNCLQGARAHSFVGNGPFPRLIIWSFVPFGEWVAFQ